MGVPEREYPRGAGPAVVAALAPWTVGDVDARVVEGKGPLPQEAREEEQQLLCSRAAEAQPVLPSTAPRKPPCCRLMVRTTRDPRPLSPKMRFFMYRVTELSPLGLRQVYTL